MLKIRLTRTGKKRQPSFRIVVAEHSNAVKGKYLEMLGNYVPATKPKQVILKRERIEYWISQGAHPSDTVAALLKREGFENMEKFMDERNKQRKPKKSKEEGTEEGATAAKPEGGAEKAVEPAAAEPEKAEESKAEEAKSDPATEKPEKAAAEETPKENTDEKVEEAK